MIEGSAVLRETHHYFQEKAPVLYFVLSTDGEIVEANQYANDLTGRQLMGQPFRDLIVDFSGKFDLTALSNHHLKEHLLNIETASGLPQSFYFSSSKVNDQILVFGRLDAGEIENMRKELLALNQELNNLTRRLHKKNAQLQRLNKEKNQFLGMAAHDLRKPIGLVIAYSDLLIVEAAEALNREQTDFLKTISSSCLFMKQLVDDFLDVSAIEAGKFELDLQPIAFDTVLAESLKMIKLTALKKGIELEIRVENNTPRITVDAHKIEQVIINLVSNAIEHSEPADRVVISLSFNDRLIFFSVQDSGPGIAPEEVEKLFKPFGNVSTKKTNGEKSTGLGMLISRKIIEAHGGEIRVDSKLGRGTTVQFELPINGNIQ
jgi:signal transduction histidine kinase